MERIQKEKNICLLHEAYPVNADDPTNLFKTFCCTGTPNAEPSTCLNPSNVAQAFDGSNARVNGTDFCTEPVTYDEGMCRFKLAAKQKRSADFSPKKKVN